MAAVLDINAIGLDDAQQLASELAQDLGLPEYLLQALIDGESIGGGARHRRPLRPLVRIDRYSLQRPHVALPPMKGGGEWLLSGNSASRHTALQREEHEVPLTPSRGGWTVTLRSNAVETGAQFKGHPDVAAYIFEPGGKMAREQRRLRGNVALLLVAKDIEVLCRDEAPVPLAEELPARGEPWNGWKLLSLDLSDMDALFLRSKSGGLETPVLVPVSRPPQGPAITSRPVAAVSGPSPHTPRCTTSASPSAMRAQAGLLPGRGVSSRLAGRRDGRSMEAAPGVGCVRCWGVGCRRLPARDGDVLVMHGGSVVWGLMFAGSRFDHAGDVDSDGGPHDVVIGLPIDVSEPDQHARHGFDRHLAEPCLDARAELGVCGDEDLDLVGGSVSECPVPVERFTTAADDLGYSPARSDDVAQPVVVGPAQSGIESSTTLPASEGTERRETISTEQPSRFSSRCFMSTK